MENKGLKQAQDRSLEMTVNKPPSWVKHVLIRLVTRYQHSVQNDRCHLICFECKTIC